MYIGIVCVLECVKQKEVMNLRGSKVESKGIHAKEGVGGRKEKGQEMM